jgi:hypothetical protein
MKRISRYQLAMLVALVLAIKLLSLWTYSSPTTSSLGVTALQATSTPAPTAAANPSPTHVPVGDPIPIKPLSGLTSLDATVKINLDGLLKGERAQGDLTALVTANDQNKTQINVTGGLIGDIVAQVGGAVVGLFAPNKVDVYKVPEGTFVVVNALFDVCVKPNAPNATAALEQLTPQGLMTLLTGPDVARGTLVGEETRNGMQVQHYLIDGETFVQAAQNSSNPSVRTFGESLWSAEDAHLYVSSEGGYPVAFEGSFSGEFEPLEFQGDFDVAIDLTALNANTPVNLPASCNRPISQ